MSSLREIKDRIASVKSTLKITSAMKLVSSSKLRKAQKTLESLHPYEEALEEILSSVYHKECGGGPSEGKESVAVIAIASNSSLCGSFNAGVVKKTLEVVSECLPQGSVKVFAIGHRIADPLKKAGNPSEEDYSSLVAHPSYEEAESFSGKICRRFHEGEFTRVVLVYNHFVSASRWEVVSRDYLPLRPAFGKGTLSTEEDLIVEPSGEELLSELLPQVLSMRFFEALSDSCAAEHASRTLAMQTASDNASDLLSEMTLEYNKGRQQKITSEILDIVGGSVR